ncbi:unnamed protein product [Closterium sp. NIES-65]|nr:unnamed protein product [Closterium sp. NIES-65]
MGPDLESGSQSGFLYRNELVGGIPEGIFTLVSLEQLLFGDNQLTGSIPTELGNLVNLQFLVYGPQSTGFQLFLCDPHTTPTRRTMGGNQLTGSIPDTIGSFTGLTELYVLNFSYQYLTFSLHSIVPTYR